MKKFILVATICTTYFMCGSVASFAVEVEKVQLEKKLPTIQKPLRVTPPAVIKPTRAEEFKPAMDLANRKIREFSRFADDVMKKKSITLQDVKAFEDSMYEYAEAMKNALLAALNEAEKAAKSEGREGSVQYLKTFEETGSKHYEQTFRPLQSKLLELEHKVMAGEVKLDKTLIEKMSLEERNELRSTIDPDAVKELEKQMPNLMKPELFEKFEKPLFEKRGTRRHDKGGSELAFDSSHGGTGFAALFNDCDCESKSLMGRISDILVPPAEGRIVRGCVSPCVKKKWSECINCLRDRAGSNWSHIVRDWNNFVGCWNGCHGRRLKRAWCRVRCLGAFIWHVA